MHPNAQLGSAGIPVGDDWKHASRQKHGAPVKQTLGIVVPGLDLGGGVPAVASFIMQAALRSESFTVRMVSLCMASSDPASVSLRDIHSWKKGITVRHGTWRGRSFSHVGAFLCELEFQRYASRPALSKALAGCHLIQVVSGSAAWANAVLGLGVPVSLQVATRTVVDRRRLIEDAPLTPLSLWRRGMTFVADRLDDRALLGVDAVQVENPWMFQYVQQLNQGRQSNVKYAPPGIDASAFCPPRSQRVDTAPYVLCVGRLDDPRKNVALLLEAFFRCSAFVPGAELVLAGAAGPPPGFWQRAESLGVASRIRYIKRPERDELVRLYQYAAAFALPSDEEGLGVVILEAMACGRPVVATRCGGPDGIITDGYDGFLVPMDDAESMADRLVQLLKDAQLNLEMGRRARQTIESRYSEEVAGAAFLDVWENLLQRGGGARVRTHRGL